jgi:hypothetical protein
LLFGARFVFSNKQRAILPMPVKDNFTADDDYLILEDEFGRVSLIGANESSPLPIHDYVTGEQGVSVRLNLNMRLFEGVVVAVRGEEVESGDFRVLDIIEPGIPELALRPSTCRTHCLRYAAFRAQQLVRRSWLYWYLD